MMRARPLPSLRSFVSLVLAAGFLLSSPAAPWAATAEKIQAMDIARAAVRSVPRPLGVAVDRSEVVEIEKPASTVFIANPEVADVQIVTPTRVMVFGKKPGETTLIISDDAGAVLSHRTVVVKPDVSELERTLRAISPDSAIRAEAVPNGLILSGEAPSAAVVEEARRIAARFVPKESSDIINRIKVRANDQVQIKVRFAEVSRDVDKRFGIDWEAMGNIGSFAVGLATGADFYTAGKAIARTKLGDATNDAIYGNFTNSHFNINGMIDALAQDGLVTILAEPSLTALSGETASFLAGGEFPVPVPQSQDTITIEWKQYGVSLAFTPTIIGENRINLHVRPEVSQLSGVGAITLNNVEVPALTTRRAETTLELNSGQSFALGGLLNNQQTQSIDKFPFLGDIPILGPLFRSSRFQNNESELVIIITPYIVKPARQEKFALPTDGLSPPSDGDFFFGMRRTNSDKSARPLTGQPRAVKVEDVPFDNVPEPVPAAAPRAAVQPAASAAPLAAAPMSTPAATPKPLVQKSSSPSAPTGPGGFIME